MGMLISTILLLSILSPRPGIPAGQTATRVRLEDNSDWWSGERSLDSGESIGTQQRELSPSNFRVLGIELEGGMFSHAATKLGKATLVERGDAATGREQACYASTREGENVHFIFERGEVDSSFYLFIGGPA